MIYKDNVGEYLRMDEIYLSQYEYPKIEQGYKISMELKQIYNQNIIKGMALIKLAKWYDKVKMLDSRFFNSVIQILLSDKNEPFFSATT